MQLVQKFILVALTAFFFSGFAAAQERAGDYRLGSGDGIRITVFQNPDLTLETRVAERGAVTYPLIGTVQLGGLTISEAEQLIARKLAEGKFVQRPQVSILLLQIKGNQVAVLGMVNRPGRFPIETGNTRVSDMLATAGGPIPPGSMAAPFGAADVVVVTGTREGKAYRREIDIPGMLLGTKSENDILVADGDVLYLHRAPVFYIYGEVQRAGTYRLERGMTVLQALATGGGLSARGTERGLRIYRRKSEGEPQVIQPAMTDTLLPDDVVQVRESLF